MKDSIQDLKDLIARVSDDVLRHEMLVWMTEHLGVIEGYKRLPIATLATLKSGAESLLKMESKRLANNIGLDAGMSGNIRISQIDEGEYTVLRGRLIYLKWVPAPEKPTFHERNFR